MIVFFDTTLRDGGQSEHISFSLEDKINIAKLLDQFGIQYIEGGWPGSNPKDIDFFENIGKLKNSKVTAFGSTRRGKTNTATDPNIQALLKSKADAVCIFGKTWDLHVKQALKVSMQENLAMIKDSVFYLKKKMKEVIYDAEHFFDGYKNNPDYALKTLASASEAGADYLVLCDTNGGTMTWEVEEIIKDVQKNTSTKLGIHTHNDSELGVANSLVAVKKGVQMVQGTINGIGERCGNANLISVIANLHLKMKMPLLKKQKLKNLYNLGHNIRELCNMDEWQHQPFIGKSAFAHKGGIHVSAILKNPHTYEHITPDLVGNRRRVLISELSGISNLRYKILDRGFNIDEKDPQLKEIIQELKKLENTGYSYEGADASLELLIAKMKNKLKEYFVLDGYQVYDGRRSFEKDTYSEATIKIKAKKAYFHTASSGSGPVDALNNALRKAIINFYPNINEVSLKDYKVRILNKVDSTAAKTRVLITSGDHKENWTTVGVSHDIIRASYIALTDSFIYKLYKDQV
jgi:2-isopropylmalate synthase